MIDAVGNMTRYKYSLTGHLEKVIDALENETEYTYNENDQLTGVFQQEKVSEEAERITHT